MMPPNILWIVTTQWRAQACGYAGDPNARTPELDAFAGRSVNHAEAVTPHPFGPFARAAMLTGVPCPQNGVHEYFDPLPADARTIAHHMRERGYATAFFGKWHLGRRDPAAPLVGEPHARTRVPPESRGGFELWEGFESGFLLNDPWLHGSRLPQPVRFRGYQPAVLVERAGTWWRERAGGPKPRFCIISIETPHPPYDAAAGGEVVDPGSLVLPPNVPRGGAVEARTRRELAGYYAHVRATDAAIGPALNGFDDDGGARGTVVLFTSVHGDMHGAHGLFRKGWPHEESVRVPLLVRMTDSPGGAISRAAVSLLDLSRLTLRWADGERARVTAGQAPISMPSVVALPDQCDRIWRGLRSRTRKLVLNADGSPWLFFDLERDPWEMQNLAVDPSRAEEIRAMHNAFDGEPRRASSLSDLGIFQGDE